MGVIPPTIIELGEDVTVSDSIELVLPVVVSLQETLTVNNSIVTIGPPVGLSTQQAKKTASDDMTSEQLT